MDRWGIALDRAAGIRKVTPILANVLGAIYSLYMTWNTYVHPDREFSRFEKPIGDLFGANGLMVGWLLICVGCLIYGYRFYQASKVSQQRPNH
jgi:hypothetical protein